MDRRKARQEAFCILFEYFFNEDVTVTDIIAREAEEREFKADEYITEVTQGAAENKDKLDEMIKPYLKGWKMERLSRVSLCILRLAVYEIVYMDDIPVNASVNEAVELAKAYDTDNAPSFINGTLRAFIRDLEEKYKDFGCEQ